MILKIFNPFRFRPLSLFAFLATGLLLSSATAQGAPSEKPNIVVVLVDDLGFSDISSYGGEIPTPNLDRLAAEGMRMTQFYNASRCMPTRVALLTGRYNHLAGSPMMEGKGARYDEATGERIGGTSNGAVLRETPTLGEVFRHNGYQTWHTGKWHAGEHFEYQWPLQRGFDKFYGTVKGATPNKFNGANVYEGNEEIEKPVPEGWFIGNAITDKALEYIRDRDTSKPFFLYHCPLEPHWPFQAPEEDIEPFRGMYDVGYEVLRQQRHERAIELGVVPEGTELEPYDPFLPSWEKFKELHPEWFFEQRVIKNAEAYAGSIKNLDDNVGRIVAELEREGILDNTILLFLSDNGSEHIMATKDGIMFPWSTLHNTPFRWHKLSQHHGGTATPFIVRWPDGGIPAGAMNTGQVGHVKDIMGTLLEATGAEFPEENLRLETWPHQSESLLAAWRDPAHDEPRTLFFEHNGNRAVRQGDWRLVRTYHPLDWVPGALRDSSGMPFPEYYAETHGIEPPLPPFNARPLTGEWELYNVEIDRSEMNNLADQYPEKVAELAALFDAFWESTNWKIREDMFSNSIEAWKAEHPSNQQLTQ